MKPNVDVLVGGPINGVAPCQYKTKILKANLPFKDQVEGEANENTKFVVKWDFDLKEESVTIPENCVLEFDGGSLNRLGNLLLSKRCHIKGSNKSIINIQGSLYVNQYCKISDVSIRRTALFDTPDDSLIVISDGYVALPDDSFVNYNIVFDNCEIQYLITNGHRADAVGNAVDIRSGYESGAYYKGMYGIYFNNVFVCGYFSNAFYIHSSEQGRGWITDVNFIECFIERCENGWNLKGWKRASVDTIFITSCAIQSSNYSKHAIDCGFAGNLHVQNTEFFDWYNEPAIRPYRALKFTNQSYSIFIDYVIDYRFDFEDVSGTGTISSKEIHIGDWLAFNMPLSYFIDLSAKDIRLLDWYNLPNGVYTIPQNAINNPKLGLMCNMGGTLWVTGVSSCKQYMYLSLSNDPMDGRREVAFMTLTAVPGINESLTGNASTLWFKPLRKVIQEGLVNVIYDYQQLMNIYFKGRRWKIAQGVGLPELTSGADAGEIFINSTYSMPAVHLETTWRYLMTRPVKLYGSSSERPLFENITRHKGLSYFDTDLNKAIWWTGINWVDVSGDRITYVLTLTFSDLKATNRQTPNVGEQYTTTLVADEHFTLPSSITVKMGATTLTEGTDYTYDSSTGEIVVLGVGGSGGVTNNMVITATGTPV